MKCEHGNDIRMSWTSKGRETVEHVLIAFEGCDQCAGIWVTDEGLDNEAIHPINGVWEELDSAAVWS